MVPAIRSRARGARRPDHGLLLACAHGTGYKPIVAAAEAEVAGKLDEAHANAARIAAVVRAVATVHATL